MLACRALQPQARLGIVVAKKNIKLAVDRNRLKRLVRESFRKQQLGLLGLDIVVIIKKDATGLSDVLKMIGDKHAAKTSDCFN